MMSHRDVADMELRRSLREKLMAQRARRHFHRELSLPRELFHIIAGRFKWQTELRRSSRDESLVPV
jgi:hypothetical protein